MTPSIYRDKATIHEFRLYVRLREQLTATREKHPNVIPKPKKKSAKETKKKTIGVARAPGASKTGR